MNIITLETRGGRLPALLWLHSCCQFMFIFKLNFQKNRSLLRCLRLWVCSGEILPVSLAKEFFKYFQENNHVLCNFYGSTEIMGDVTYYVAANLDQLKQYEKVPIGKIIVLCRYVNVI